MSLYKILWESYQKLNFLKVNNTTIFSLSLTSLSIFFSGRGSCFGQFYFVNFFNWFSSGIPDLPPVRLIRTCSLSLSLSKQVSDGISFGLQSCKFYRERILHAISPKQEMDTQRTCHITSHWGGRGQLLLFYIPIIYLTQLQSTLSFLM